MSIICSDVHLGFEDTNYDAFHDFLDYVETNKSIMDKFILNGDIIEMWRISYDSIRADPVYNDAFVHLQETANELANNDVETIFCLGNHDYMADKVIKDDLNVSYKHSYIIDDVIVKHGWEQDFVQQFFFFDALVSPAVYAIISDFMPAIYQQFYRKPSEVPTSEYVDNISWIDGIRKKAVEFAAKIGVPTIILGHRHHPEITGNFVDCGDFIDSISWCEITNGIPELKDLKHKYHL